MLAEGELAPDFTLTGDDGEVITLSSLRGRPVVLYFYPRDDTPATFCSTPAALGLGVHGRERPCPR